ncbi:MAG: ABC transporter substrate-binding protein [Cyanophyceae cyanobacterium]
MIFLPSNKSSRPGRSHWLSTRTSRNSMPFNAQRRKLLLAGGSALIAASCSRNSFPGNPSRRSRTASAAEANTPARSIKHAYGETIIPANPQRVAVVELSTMEASMALGIEPIAAPQLAIDNLSHLPKLDGETINTGAPNSPNLEMLVRAQPDLILTSQFVTNDDTYQMLSRIAPAIALDIQDFTDWKKAARLCGEVFGKEAEVQKLENDYAARLKELRSTSGTDLANTQASVAVVFSGRIAVRGSQSFSGTVLEDVGVSRPSKQDQARGLLVSMETLEDIDGDMLFLLQPESQTEIAKEIRKANEATQANPLWSKLNVVQNNRVYSVDAHWYGANYLAANRILDDLERYCCQ